MVYTTTSQISQFTERFFHQSGLFEFFPNTTSGIDWFLVSDLKFRYMGKTGAKSKKLALTYIGDTVNFAKNNLQMDQRYKTSLFNGNNFTDIHNFKLR
jgi:hypothetical protein